MCLSDDGFYPTPIIDCPGSYPVSSQKWGIPVLSLSTYLRFWSVICFFVTVWLTFFQKEVRACFSPTSTQLTKRFYQRKEILRDEDTSITGVYRTIWSILKLKRRPL